MSAPIIRRRGDGDEKSMSDLMVGSREEMIDVAWKVAMSYISSSAPTVQELIALREHDNPRDAVADYFLIAKQARWSVRGVVSKVGKVQFEAMVRTSIDAVLKNLTETWPADWCVVACVLEDSFRERQERRAKEDPSREIAWQAQAAAIASAKGAEAISSRTPTSSQKHEAVTVKEDDLVLHLVITDLSKRPLFDPLQQERPGNTSGGMFRFAETQRVSDLPRSLKVRRQLAIELLQEYAGSTPEKAELTDEQKSDVKKMLEMGLPQDKVAKVFGVSPLSIEDLLPENTNTKRVSGRKPKGEIATPKALQ